MGKLELLKNEKASLEDKICRMEMDLREPQDRDRSEESNSLGSQIVLRRLLEIERSNLRRVNVEIDTLQSARND